MSTSAALSRPKRGPFRLRHIFQAVVLVLVAWGIWRTVANAQLEFTRAAFSVRQLDARWLGAAGLAYLAGLFPCGIFWRRTLLAMGQSPNAWQTMRAFYIGHLGKYFPGKALVVILRTALIRGPRVNTTVAATSIFVETLTMMAVGAVLATLILAVLFREQPQLLVLGLLLGAAAGVPTLPPVFRRLVLLLQVKRLDPTIEHALAGLNYRLMAFGWLIVSAGWLLIGISLWAVVQALPATVLSTAEARPVAFDVLLLTACAALAMVAGFLSLIPGGAGVREYVVMALMQPLFGPVAAVVSAIAVRVVWMAAEGVAALLLYAAGVRKG